MIAFPNLALPSGVQINMNNSKFIPNPYVEEMISKLAQEETGKRQYYRPVYSLHKWWARRPGALFRSIILAASRPELADALLKPDRDGSLSAESHYFRNHNLGDVIILDPFMGGGTTLVEANRLGAKVIGCDINPVSFWVVRETLKPIDLKRLDFYFRQLEENAGERIKSLYGTTCRWCQASSEGLYAFWVRYVDCLHCGEVVYLFKRTLLNEGLSRNKPVSPTNPAIAFCPQCHALNEWYGEEHCVCIQCSLRFDPQVGTYQEGYYTCPHCRKGKISLIQTLKAGQRLREELVAIEYQCPRCTDRWYKSPDADDLIKIEAVKQTFMETQEQLVFPRQPILEGASSVRWRQHNYRYYFEVFNPRQLLAFNYLIEAIQAIPEEEYRNAFITIFSNSLEYNNMMTPYNYPHRKLHHLFNYHAMPLTTTPVENAVWGVSEEGAGTFVNCYGRYVRAKQYCLRPFDKFKGLHGKIKTVDAQMEKIAAHFVTSFEDLQRTPRGALLLCGDSSSLPMIPERSVDFVITDPPYFDNIHYSELSNFFYVWLSRLIEHPYFTLDHVPTEQEAIVNEGMAKGEEDYRNLLSSVFQECRRVLKDAGRLIFTFHHTKWRAWWTVFTALMESGFCIIDSFPVMSEYKVNPHVRDKQALDMDLVIICAKRSELLESWPLSLDQVVQRAMENISQKGSNGNPNRLFLYFMGELLKAASAAWNTQAVTYEWLVEALTHFNERVARRIYPPSQDGSDQEAQLSLFDDLSLLSPSP